MAWVAARRVLAPGWVRAGLIWLRAAIDMATDTIHPSAAARWHLAGCSSSPKMCTSPPCTL